MAKRRALAALSSATLALSASELPSVEDCRRASSSSLGNCGLGRDAKSYENGPICISLIHSSLNEVEPVLCQRFGCGGLRNSRVEKIWLCKAYKAHANAADSEWSMRSRAELAYYANVLQFGAHKFMSGDAVALRAKVCSDWHKIRTTCFPHIEGRALCAQ